MKGNITNTGYKKDSKDKNNDFNIIPSNNITMNNVEFPVLGISNIGDTKMMYPNNKYTFNGDFVTEFPQNNNNNMTKDQILKIAKVNNEAEFYRKYPSEEAFMKVHEKAFKKAALGASIQDKGQLKKLDQLTSFDQAQKGKAVSGKVNYISIPIGDNNAMQSNYTVDLNSKQRVQRGDGGFTHIYNAQDANGRMTTLQEEQIAPYLSGAHNNYGVQTILPNGRVGSTDSLYVAPGVSKFDVHIPKKALVGDYISSPKQINSNVNFKGLYNNIDISTTGDNEQTRLRKEQVEAQKKQANATTSGGSSSGGTGDLANIAMQIAPMIMKKGGKLKKAQNGDLVSVMPNQGQFDTPNAPQSLPAGAQPQINKSSLISGTAPDSFMKQAKDMGIGQIGNMIGDFQQIDQANKDEDTARQFAGVSNVVSMAAASRPEQVKRKYVRPEDQVIPQGALNQSYGEGNGIQMKKGGRIAEIQNTYAPYNIYTDSGYEPLDDSDIETAQDGGFFSGMGNEQAGNLGQMAGSFIGGGKGKASGASKLGSTAGGIVGTAVGGPIGGLIGSAAGGLIGGVIGGGQAKRTENYNNEGLMNMQTAAFQQGSQNIQNQYSGQMKDGGWMNPEYNPQVITKFGNVDVSDIHNIFTKGMDTLRAGGHLKEYTPPSADALQTYAMGGELQTHWGGEARPISNNPYLPDGGETVMFHGQSHDESDGKGRSGIGVTFGQGSVEVQRNEPAVKLQDGGSPDDTNLTVFGGMQIGKSVAQSIGDPKAASKKYQSYATDISKNEAKQNKLINNSLLNAADLTDDNILGINTNRANLIGANMKLKEAAQRKTELGLYQNAILDTAEEHGLVADELAKGRIKKAKYGAKIDTAQDGKSTSSWFNTATAKPVNRFINNVSFSTTPPPSETTSSSSKKTSQNSKSDKKKDSSYLENLPAISLPKFIPPTETYDGGAPAFDYTPIGATKPQEPIFFNPIGGTGQYGETPVASVLGANDGISPKKTPHHWTDDALMVGRQLVPYARTTNKSPLDASQLAGEMYAMSANQLEPVQAQMYHPLLEQPFSVSMQDQRNANQADFNAMQRIVGNNPEALAALAAQKYGANSAIGAAEFRANQAAKMEAYNRNRQQLNEAQKMNLSLLDQQYERQSKAKSATKAETEAILNSISAKVAQNKLENKQIGVMENMYNYRYDNQGRLINENAPTQFNIPNVGTGTEDASNIPSTPISSNDYVRAKALVDLYDKREKKAVKAATPKSRNGALVKAIKNL